MALEIDYLPVAIAAGANIDTQTNFSGSAYQENGFIAGTAMSFQANKVWRQSSMMSAALANFISSALDISVLDDGNLTNLINNLTNAISTAAKAAGNGLFVSLTDASLQTMAGPLAITSVGVPITTNSTGNFSFEANSSNTQQTGIALLNSSIASSQLTLAQLGSNPPVASWPAGAGLIESGAAGNPASLVLDSLGAASSIIFQVNRVTLGAITSTGLNAIAIGQTTPAAGTFTEVQVASETGDTVAAFGQITTINPKQLIIQNSPSTNTVTIEALQAGVAFNQTLALNPSGGPVTVGPGGISVNGTVTATNIAALQSQVNTADGNITTLQGQVSTLNEEMSTADSNIATLQGQMATADGNITTLQGQVSTLNEEMSTADSNIATLQGQMAIVLTSPSLNNVTGQRPLGETFQNTSPVKMEIYATYFITGSFGQGFSVGGFIGPNSGSLNRVAVASIHNDSGEATVQFSVPSGWFYSVSVDNSEVTNPQIPTLEGWFEVING
jgi:hypothetical protein